VLRFEEGLTPAGVRDLAEAIAGECGGVAAVLTGEGESWQVCLVGPAEAVKAKGAAMTQALGGRGGGKAGFFQGRVKASRGDIEGFFGNMEKYTGTLWEYKQHKGSYDHGFASYALVVMETALKHIST
jgi:hypothetical protein